MPMANPEHLAILEKGVDTWNRWREKECRLRSVAELPSDDISLTPLERASLGTFHRELVAMLCCDEVDLSGACLSGAKLSRANLCQANLSEADLRWADLAYTNLVKANLIHSNLRSADLGGANLLSATLRSADLHAANLVSANFQDADLTGAIMSRAVVGFSVFSNTDLTAVEGLDLCHHYGPSTIDPYTVVRFPNVPLAFLRGCGLSDSLIDYLPSLLKQSIQFYSCFISYSTSDQDFANRLHADLQNHSVRCWFAPHDVRGGRKLHDQVDEAIRIYDRLLLILSGHSMNSEWVKTEIAHARKKELKEGRHVLFPISVVPFASIREWKCSDADTGKDSAREIREYFIPDFSRWKDHDCYQQAFQRLLNDLKFGKAVSINRL
jgi:TIR domain/Pentapeptide repeats (8 copies)